MQKFIFLLLIALLSTGTAADDLSIDINLHAHHFNRTDVAKYDLNEINPGIGLHFTNGDYHKMIGIYKNSVRKTSAYALLGWTPINIGPVHIGAIGGAVTGYAVPYTPAAGMFTVIDLGKSITLNITAVPTIRSMKVVGFAGFQLSVKL